MCARQLQHRRVHVRPVAEDVERDQCAEVDEIGRVQVGEHDTQACRRRAIRHHVKHRAEKRGLVERARSVPIRRVEQRRDKVASERAAIVRDRKVESHQIERDPHVADDVRYVEVHGPC